MGPFAVKLGMSVLCAAALAGCDSVPDLGWDHQEQADIQILAMGQTGACRYITDVSATSSYSEEQDMQRAATRKVFVLAAEKGGNAVQIVSTSIVTSDKPTTTTVSAKLYTCNRELGRITQ